MHDSADATPGLVVPIDVVAFCVGSTDPERTAKFAGATVNYNMFLNSSAAALMGGNVTRGFQDTMDALEPGVHLHWALPDALTRATGPDLDFPAVPNRWLVTRIVVDGATLTPSSFIVESDTLSASSSQAGALVVPVKPVANTAGATPPVGFEYLGRSMPLESYDASALRALAEGTGGQLTAVSNGVPSFAAYYPEGRNSFGFHDPMCELPASALLMYVVTGWYQDGAHDPAHLVHGTGATGRTLADTHSWLCAGTEGYTLYSGAVQQVGWAAATNHVPENPAPITADAALANTPAEALAAWFADSMKLGGVLPEQLLTAFQQGLWDRLAEPAAPVLAQLREALHDSQFNKVDAGTVYSIHQLVDGEDQEALDLPAGIAAALDAVNLAAAALLDAGNRVDQFRWRTFADWYRYFASCGPNGVADQTAIADHFFQTLMPLWDSGLKQAYEQASAALATRLAALDALLQDRPGLARREEPGRRYLRPNDPVLLLRGDELAKPLRYGGDNTFHPTGKLLARPTTALVSAVSIGAQRRSAGDFAAATVLAGAALPYAADCSALLAEAILLNADVAAAWSGQTVPVLDAGLATLLAGEDSGPWRIDAGSTPSPVALNVWNGNPWLPLFLTWDAGFAPLQPTLHGSLFSDYPPAFLSANFTLDQSEGSFLSYTPGDGGTSIDPRNADYSHGYSGGWTMLSGKPAANFRGQISTYLAGHKDATLEQIGYALDQSSFLVQPIAGFTDRLLTRNTLMQVSVVVTPQMKHIPALLTQATAGVLATGAGPVTYHVTPVFGEAFNPIRAGWLSFGSLSVTAVDAFGQRRPVQFGATCTAASMAALPPGGGGAEPGYAFASPRLAQASRLLFAWLAAADSTTVEYNDHPAESPICGWVMPNHLTGGFFFYEASGRPLGSLFVAGDDVAGAQTIVWQGAPGDDRDIDTSVVADPVVAAAHPQLRDLVRHLGTVARAADFQAFYTAVDTAHGSINPANLATDAGLAVLAGRPVALVQAALSLDLQGPPVLNQNRACMTTPDDGASYWVDSDAGLSGVQFPVVLGDLDNLDDGLVGFYRGDTAGGYDLGSFFSQAAPAGAGPAVVQPTQGTLRLTPAPAAGGATAPAAQPMRVLMLVDPRAPVHAFSGILPTQSLLVPPNLASAALSTLEISMQAAPVLRAAGGLAMPRPDIPGFELSFLEQRRDGARKRWRTLPGITPAVANAMWSYTPQSLTEGWLRLNPALIGAALINGRGQPVAAGGQVQAMTLRITNRKATPVSFAPDGSVLYIRFGTLVAAADVAALEARADGWSFTVKTDPADGACLAATCAAPLTLDAAGAASPATDFFDIALSGLKAAAGIVQATVQVDYYEVEGIVDGIASASVTVTPAATAPREDLVQ
jgi:hypothetical protein